MSFKTKMRLTLLKEHLYYFVVVVFGAGIMALGTALFLLPNQLSTGGFSGIATILYYFFNLPMGTTILILNIPFFILAIYKIGKEFFIKSLIGILSFSVFLNIFEKWRPLTEDRFLACIYGGIIMRNWNCYYFKI